MIRAFNESNKSPYIKRQQTIYHPGEVNPHWLQYHFGAVLSNLSSKLSQWCGQNPLSAQPSIPGTYMQAPAVAIVISVRLAVGE